MVVAILAIITSVGFATLLCMIMKNKTCAKAAITRAPSEAAYDNPTYKVRKSLSKHKLDYNQEKSIQKFVPPLIP